MEAEPQMMFALGQPPLSNTISKREKITIVKDSINVLLGIHNTGVIEGGGEYANNYKSLFNNEIYKEQLEDYIMDLSKVLVQQTKSLFKNGTTK